MFQTGTFSLTLVLKQRKCFAVEMTPVSQRFSCLRLFQTLQNTVTDAGGGSHGYTTFTLSYKSQRERENQEMFVFIYMKLVSGNTERRPEPEGPDRRLWVSRQTAASPHQSDQTGQTGVGFEPGWRS